VEKKTRTVLTIDEVKSNQHLEEKLFALENLGNAPGAEHSAALETTLSTSTEI